ncbi:MAG: hypothetical protein GEV28_26150 [Actinophytocola sp.]|uniref:hypothetical protein n=1 Tax=Actinophytocola sp. TaxID=1872138 RepID=UPI00132B9768|nr:hypothetical protein [Actinophytocola sp.]MPZ83685.1 hypothetical protein [Actinophytocola sp.]
MAYPQGNWQQGGYSPQTPGYPQQPPRGNPAPAVIAGVLGLGVAGTLGYQCVDLLMDIPDGFSLPGRWTAMIVAHLVVVAIALLGAVLVFARRIAGAFLLLAAALLTVLVVLVDPVLANGIAVTMLGAAPDISATGEVGAYYELLVEFGNEQAVLRFLAACVALVLLVIAALPPVLNYLRRAPR